VTEAIIVSIITGVFTFAGVIITVIYGNKKTDKNIKTQTDLTLYRIEQLELKQDKHNTLIERMYAVEEKIDLLAERQKVSNHRINDLEGYHK
jgi:epoxyqueuosine reductase QueG